MSDYVYVTCEFFAPKWKKGEFILLKYFCTEKYKNIYYINCIEKLLKHVLFIQSFLQYYSFCFFVIYCNPHFLLVTYCSWHIVAETVWVDTFSRG